MVQSSPPACGGSSRLTAAERATIDRARTLAGLRGNALREHARVPDPAMAMATVLGECQHVLAELAAVLERVGEG